MIRAHRIGWCAWLLVRLIRGAMRRTFFAVVVERPENPELLDPGKPVIACSNHCNWWDGFAGVLFARTLPGRHTYLAQENAKLAEASFFRFTGAFGISSGRDGIAGLRHALEILKNPQALVWIFPQGELRAAHARIDVKPGTGFLAEKSGATVLPVAFRYEWFSESRPSLIIRCGKPQESNISEEALASTLTALRDGPISPETLANPHWLIPPRRSLNRRWADLFHKNPSQSPWNPWKE